MRQQHEPPGLWQLLICLTCTVLAEGALQEEWRLVILIQIYVAWPGTLFLLLYLSHLSAHATLAATACFGKCGRNAEDDDEPVSLPFSLACQYLCCRLNLMLSAAELC